MLPISKLSFLMCSTLLYLFNVLIYCMMGISFKSFNGLLLFKAIIQGSTVMLCIFSVLMDVTFNVAYAYMVRIFSTRKRKLAVDSRFSKHNIIYMGVIILFFSM